MQTLYHWNGGPKSEDTEVVERARERSEGQVDGNVELSASCSDGDDFANRLLVEVWSFTDMKHLACKDCHYSLLPRWTVDCVCL